MKKYRKNKDKNKKLITLFVVLIALAGFKFIPTVIDNTGTPTYSNEELTQIEYDGIIAVQIENNKPDFTEEELEYAKGQKQGYEEYSNLDDLGRCGVAMACLCEGTRPSYGEKRGNIGNVYPSGWQKINFWQRCHLIGWQLSAENDNEKNLITGTAYMNVSGMLPYENMVAEYLNDNDDGHVLYRVEPIFKGSELVARGVEMEAYSLEDDGEAVCFHVYIFNYQPGYNIDYIDGKVEDDTEHQTVVVLKDMEVEYTGNAVKIEDVDVEGSTGNVRYIFYSDSAGKNKISTPKERGVYYVRAYVSGDNWYPSGVSKLAKLVIK